MKHKYSFFCKHCGAAHNFETKEDKKTYEDFHYKTDKRYPGVKICKDLVPTNNNSMARISAALKLQEEDRKKHTTINVNWEEEIKKYPAENEDI